MKKNILMHTGRILLALYFLIPGVSKFHLGIEVTLMETHNMPMIPLLLQ